MKPQEIEVLKGKISHNRGCIDAIKEQIQDFEKSYNPENDIFGLERKASDDCIEGLKRDIKYYEDEIAQWELEIESGKFKGFY